MFSRWLFNMKVNVKKLKEYIYFVRYAMIRRAIVFQSSIFRTWCVQWKLEIPRVVFDELKEKEKKNIKSNPFVFPLSGVHLLRPGCPQSRLCHDLLRGGQRRLFVAIRIANEIRRPTAADGIRRYRSRLSCGRSPHVETSSWESLRLLLGLGTVGSWRCRMADAGQRWVFITLHMLNVSK